MTPTDSTKDLELDIERTRLQLFWTSMTTSEFSHYEHCKYLPFKWQMKRRQIFLSPYFVIQSALPSDLKYMSGCEFFPKI